MKTQPNSISNWPSYWPVKKRLFENYFIKYCQDAFSNSLLVKSQLTEAISYATLDGGKRVRPILTIICFEIFSDQQVTDENNPIMPIAAAMEMVHTYTLIHDDLPSMDDDLYRRGKLTLHRKYSEALAILTGDGFLAESFRILFHSPLTNPAILAQFSEACGFSGTICGQMRDIFHEQLEITTKEFELTYNLKTGLLLKTSALCGALAAGIDEKYQVHLSQFCDKLGLIYQITDDLLDMTVPNRKNNSLNYALSFGLNQTKDRIEELYEQSLKCLRQIDANTENLEELLNFVCHRKG